MTSKPCRLACASKHKYRWALAGSGHEAAYFQERGKGIPSDHSIEVPRKLDAPIQKVYITKIAFLLLSFILITAEILRRNFGDLT